MGKPALETISQLINGLTLADDVGATVFTTIVCNSSCLQLETVSNTNNKQARGKLMV
jgi:hypothetical protein